MTGASATIYKANGETMGLFLDNNTVLVRVLS